MAGLTAIMFVTITSYFLIALGFYMRDRIVMILGGLMIIGITIFTAYMGIDELTSKTLPVISFTVINFGMGAYISIMSGYDLIKQNL